MIGDNSEPRVSEPELLLLTPSLLELEDLTDSRLDKAEEQELSPLAMHVWQGLADLSHSGAGLTFKGECWGI